MTMAARRRRGGVNRGSIHCGALGGKGGDKKEGLLAFHIKDHTLHTHILYLKRNPWVLIHGGNKSQGATFESKKFELSLHRFISQVHLLQFSMIS